MDCEGRGDKVADPVGCQPAKVLPTAARPGICNPSGWDMKSPASGVATATSAWPRADLTAALEERWQTALAERGRIAPRSPVHLLDELLAAQD